MESSRIEQLKHRLHAFLWETPDLSALPWPRAIAVFVLRVVAVMVREFREGQLTLRAMSLVYTTLLSLVPLLALSFSVLKAFGVHNQIEPFLLQMLAPLGEKGAEITARVIDFVENVKVGVLGALGLGLLLYTVIALMQKIERAFNYTWHVQQTRPLGQRFSDYLSVLIVGPVLVFASIGFSASILNSDLMQALAEVEPFGSLLNVTTRLLPYLMIIAAFTFLYVFIPNTRVRLRSAFAGALVAGILWQTVGWAFTAFIVNATKYTAIYSAFASLIMFMIWLYLGWMILLVGASIAFYHQYPEYLLAEQRQPRLSGRLRERLALEACARVARAYHRGDAPPTATGLARALVVPRFTLQQLLDELEDAGILRRVADERVAYVPGREPGTLALADILAAVRGAGETRRPAEAPPDRRADAAADAVEQAVHAALDGRSLADLLEDQSADEGDTAGSR